MENEFGLTSWITDAGVVHIDVHGELDADTADRLVNALGIYREPLTHCVIDLSDCHFIDSSGLRALLLCQLHLHVPHRLVLRGVGPQAERALAVTRMDSVFDFEPMAISQRRLA